MASEMILETIWTDKSKYDDAERQHYESLAELPKESKGCKKEVCPVINPPVPNTPAVNQSKKSKSAEIAVVVAQQIEPVEVPKIPTPAIEPRKTEGKEKSSKKNKKAREAQRQRDLLNNSTSNKDVPPSPTKEEEIILTPIVKTETNVKAPKTKEAKEKLNKSDKKQSNKKDNASNNTCKNEDKQAKNENVEVKINEKGGATKNTSQCSLASEVAKARQHIKNSLECMDSVLASVPNVEVVNRLNSLESANSKLQSTVDSLQKIISGLQSDMAKLLVGNARPMPAVCPMPSPANPKGAPAKAAPPAPSKEDSDDGVDLFASDSEEDDEAATKIKEDRVAAYAAKKSTKPALIAKSNIILDVKPWDDETDMAVIEKNVRSLGTDGLLWGVSKLVPVGYGIRKLRIACVVEDDKVSIDWLTEEIEKFEEVVQSVDIHAFNKV